jgi:hypothetical protein
MFLSDDNAPSIFSFRIPVAYLKSAIFFLLHFFLSELFYLNHLYLNILVPLYLPYFPLNLWLYLHFPQMLLYVFLYQFLHIYMLYIHISDIYPFSIISMCYFLSQIYSQMGDNHCYLFFIFVLC